MDWIESLREILHSPLPSLDNTSVRTLSADGPKERSHQSLSEGKVFLRLFTEDFQDLINLRRKTLESVETYTTSGSFPLSPHPRIYYKTEKVSSLKIT